MQHFMFDRLFKLHSFETGKHTNSKFGIIYPHAARSKIMGKLLMYEDVAIQDRFF